MFDTFEGLNSSITFIDDVNDWTNQLLTLNGSVEVAPTIPSKTTIIVDPIPIGIVLAKVIFDKSTFSKNLLPFTLTDNIWLESTWLLFTNKLVDSFKSVDTLN